MLVNRLAWAGGMSRVGMHIRLGKRAGITLMAPLTAAAIALRFGAFREVNEPKRARRLKGENSECQPSYRHLSHADLEH
jgi:hypothetical protein